MPLYVRFAWLLMLPRGSILPVSSFVYESRGSLYSRLRRRGSRIPMVNIQNNLAPAMSHDILLAVLS
jgi:hypothetical protein